MRRIAITILVLVILAFLFPLSDDDKRREPNGAELLIPTLVATQTPDVTTPDALTPETAVPTVSASETAEPSESPTAAETPAPPVSSPAATPDKVNTTVPNPTARTVTTPNSTANSSSTAAPPAARSTNTPAITCTPSPMPGWEIYTVHRGDTLQGIANLVGASVAELTEVNCLDNPDHITAGQQLWAPALPDPFATPSRTPRPLGTPTSSG